MLGCVPCMLLLSGNSRLKAISLSVAEFNFISNTRSSPPVSSRANEFARSLLVGSNAATMLAASVTLLYGSGVSGLKVIILAL